MLYHGQKGSPHPRISPRHPQHGARAGLEQRLPRTSFTELPSRGAKNTHFLPRSVSAHPEASPAIHILVTLPGVPILCQVWQTPAYREPLLVPF